MFTFACESGRDRKADLSKSISAYLRGKLIQGDGKVNLVQALKEMPPNVGYTQGSNNLTTLVHRDRNWTAEKK